MHIMPHQHAMHIISHQHAMHIIPHQHAMHIMPYQHAIPHHPTPTCHAHHPTPTRHAHHPTPTCHTTSSHTNMPCTSCHTNMLCTSSHNLAPEPRLPCIAQKQPTWGMRSYSHSQSWKSEDRLKSKYLPLWYKEFSLRHWSQSKRSHQPFQKFLISSLCFFPSSVV